MHKAQVSTNDLCKDETRSFLVYLFFFVLHGSVDANNSGVLARSTADVCECLKYKRQMKKHYNRKSQVMLDCVACVLLANILVEDGECAGTQLSNL